VGTLVAVVTVGGLFARGEIGVVAAVEVVANFLIPYVVSSLGLLARTKAPLGEGR
jgi:small ligand-binding sensory domain FIST